MPIRKHKLVKTRKFQKDLNQRLTEMWITIKEIRRFLTTYRTASPEESTAIEEKLEVLLEDLNQMTKILYRHRKYYEELREQFDEIKRVKYGEHENTIGENGVEGDEE